MNVRTVTDALLENEEVGNVTFESDSGTSILAPTPKTKNDSTISNNLPQKIFQPNYLRGFNHSELNELTAKYNKSVEDLDQEISHYRKTYWFYYVKTSLSLTSNLLYLPFQIMTSNEGVKNFCKVFKPDINVSDTIAYAIGIPTAIMDVAVYLVTVSAHKIAAEDTLNYALREPLKTRIKNLLLNAFVKPSQAVMHLGLFMVNQTILYNVNLTGTMTLMLGAIYDGLNTLPAALKWLIILGIFYLGNDYHAKYMNPDYYKGLLEFWRNKQQQPWLVGELWRKNFATPLQVFLQGIISTVGLRSYFYYYLALQSAETLGSWFPAPLVTGCVTVHSLAALYPYTYEHYLRDKIQVEKILREKKIDNNLIASLVAKEISTLNKTNLSQAQLQKIKEQIVQKLIHAERQTLNKEIRKEHGRFFPITKDPRNLLLLTYRGLIGGYVFYEYLTPALMMLINEPISMSMLSAILGVMLFASVLYKAEANRVEDNLVLKHLEKQNATVIIQEVNPENENGFHPSPPCDLTTWLVGTGLNIGNAISGWMSTLGAVVIGGGNSPISIAATSIVGGESALNGLGFNQEKITNTLTKLRSSASKYVSNLSCTLFQRKKAEPEEKPLEPEVEVILYR